MKYMAAVFLRDILTLYGLNETSKEFEELGHGISRNVFYYVIYKNIKYLNDTRAYCLKKLMLEKTNTKNKDKLLKYLKEHIGNIDKVIQENSDNIEVIIAYAVDQFRYEKEERKVNLDLRKIKEYYIKSLYYLNKDTDTALLIVEKTIEEIVSKIIKKENKKFINGNNVKALNILAHQKIIPNYIISLIDLLNDIVPTSKDFTSKKVVYDNLKHILKWFFEDYLDKNFSKLETKAENTFYRNKTEYKISSYHDLLPQWTIIDFSRTMLNLFTESIDNLADDNVSTLDEMITINKKQPESRRIMFKGDEPIGCWSLSPLFEKEFERDCRGEFYVSEFGTITMPTFIKGVYDIHFGVICIKEEHRNFTTFNLLLSSIVKFIEDLALNGIYINNICTQAYSDNGKSLAEGIGLNYTIKHKDGKGDVYVGTIKDLLNKPFLRDFTLLKSLYKGKSLVGVEPTCWRVTNPQFSHLNYSDIYKFLSKIYSISFFSSLSFCISSISSSVKVP